MLPAMTGRTAGAFLLGAFVAAWISRAVFHWILDVHGILLILLIAGAAVGGGLLLAIGDAEDRRTGS